jgi:hypothetical protein
MPPVLPDRCSPRSCRACLGGWPIQQGSRARGRRSPGAVQSRTRQSAKPSRSTVVRPLPGRRGGFGWWLPVRGIRGFRWPLSRRRHCCRRSLLPPRQPRPRQSTQADATRHELYVAWRNHARLGQCSGMTPDGVPERQRHWDRRTGRALGVRRSASELIAAATGISRGAALRRSRRP